MHGIREVRDMGIADTEGGSEPMWADPTGLLIHIPRHPGTASCYVGPDELGRKQLSTSIASIQMDSDLPPNCESTVLTIKALVV